MDGALDITADLRLPLREIEIDAIRAQGAGGQNIHKTSSAAQLCFDVHGSSMPEDLKTRLLAIRDQRIGRDGSIVIKAQRFRSLEQNRADALERLAALIRRAAVVPRARKPTKPTRSSQRKRLDSKTRHGRLKVLRRDLAE